MAAVFILAGKVRLGDGDDAVAEQPLDVGKAGAGRPEPACIERAETVDPLDAAPLSRHFPAGAAARLSLETFITTIPVIETKKAASGSEGPRLRVK